MNDQTKETFGKRHSELFAGLSLILGIILTSIIVSYTESLELFLIGSIITIFVTIFFIIWSGGLISKN